MIRRRILIDTDIGDDIDDAFAIALAASLPELELVGVTTVFRNTAQRAQLAHRLLSSLGREDIPVRAGERLPEREPIHVFERDPAGAPEDADLCQWEPAYAQLPAEDGAVDFLIRMAEKYGESLTLVPIGAMTNLARAIERNPEAMKRVGAIVTMGGKFSAEDPEWNILCDPEAAHTVYIRHIYIRFGAESGQILVCITANTQQLPKKKQLVQTLLAAEPGITTIVFSPNTKKGNTVLGTEFLPLYGDGTITDTLCGLQFRLSAPAFYQVNHAQAERLYEKAAALAGLTGEETVLDLYCGTGTITLCLARHAKKAVGVEIIPQAIEDAKFNAAQNGMDNAEFYCMDAGAAAKLLAERGEKPDVIVVDPPRKGVSADVIEAIAAMQPQRVVYVSCDPATLARDVKLLTEKGYTLRSAEAVDLFPKCAHIETVCLLSKLNVKHHIEVEITMDELDLTAAESKATYDEIKAYVLEKFGFKVSQLYIAQIKRKCGIIERKNYNQSKKEDAKVPKCPPEKEAAIMDALKHFQMIP